jgi:hypothetical protein
LWFPWVDDCIVTGSEEEMLQAKHKIMSHVDCEDGGEMKEFVGCKIDHDRSKRTQKITQPVLLQSQIDELSIAKERDVPTTLGIPLKTLQLGHATPVTQERRTYYRSGVGKLLHLRRWSRPDTANALRDLSRYNTNGSEEHITAMHRAMNYVVSTPNRGLLLAPTTTWDGNPEFEFEISGVADASYKPYLDTALSVGGHGVFLNGAPISEKSKIQQSTTLSVTESRSYPRIFSAPSSQSSRKSMT